MTFEEIVDQALAMLQRRGRVGYRMLKRQFQLDDDALEDLKAELIEVQQLAADQDGTMLAWTGEPGTASPLASSPTRAPLAYTPPYLAEKILTSKAALEGERKQVTVLFADLKSSMELLADRDPEEARQLLDPVLERMMAAVHRYEGTVNQVMGDGIMALFGAPIAHEDHAVRACYAALAIQAALRRYSDEVRRTHGLAVHFRVGLNSGEVVVRAIDNDLHMDYSAIGQTVHLAARIEQLATPGSILLTPATLRLVEGAVEVDPLGPVPVKGLPEPIAVYELRRAGPSRSRLHAAAARGLTRFVGREGELEQRRQALGRASGGHGQVVAIVGEPGVGKSRLVWEVIHSPRVHGWLVLQAGSVSYGRATSYLPVIDLLKNYCAIDDRDGPRVVQEKVTGKLLTLDRAQEGSLPALLALLDVPTGDPQWETLDPLQRRRRTLDAVKRLLLRESQVQPLLLVFEDLHWIDAETQALLDGLVESLPAARLLLLVNYRPEYQHPWGGRTYYTQLRLDPLPPESAEALLGALLGPDAGLDPLKRVLIERTEGNPFFLEESVRTLVEIGVLVGEPGAYRLAQALPTIQVPATVQAVLAARIDRLPAEDKRLLQSAAVIGTEVPWPLLQAIAELPEAVLHGGLAHLQAGEFLYETQIFPEIAYTFKHALTHEVAYGSLLQERRRVLHARIVEALEALAGGRVGEPVERLAHHALRGEVWDKALPYCRQAGEKSIARSAHREAVGYCEQALGVLPHLPETRDMREQAIDLRLTLDTALLPSGDAGRILASLREAEAFAAALDDPRRLAQVSVLLSRHFFFMGGYDRSMAAAQRALALAMADGNAVLLALANLRLGVANHHQGDYHRAIDCLRQTVASLEGARRYERFGEVFLPAVLARVFLAWCYAELGMFAEGRALGDEGLQVAEAVDHPASLMLASWGAGLLALRQGDPPRAVPLLERAVNLCQDTDLPVFFPRQAAALGMAYSQAGRVADAVPLLTRAMEQMMATEMILNRAFCSLSLGETHLLAGRLEEAHALADGALTLTCENQDRGHQAYALRLLGDIAARRELPQGEPAVAHYRQALALAEELGMRPLVAHCHRGLGMLYATIGRQEPARTELSAAVELYRSMDMTFWLPQAEAGWCSSNVVFWKQLW
jgi:class 3 adenylate cyclase/tetratricopeptide (TPR) repeat protein